jgi:ribonuclease-3
MRAKTIRKGKIWYNGKVGFSRQTIKKGTASKMKNLHQQLLTDYGIDFSDLNLLQTAFTHTSYANEHRLLKISHNERLEFLGDAVLQLIISKYLYQKYPHFPEGEMSKLRSSFVREESLAGFARSCGFDAHLLLGKGEEKSGGRNRDTILGDAFEAFLGALLLDKGEAAVEKFLYQVMIPQLEVGNFERVTDYKTSLQETLQVNGEIDITYLVIDEVGPAHDKTFTVQVMADQKVIGQGKGRSKKLAEQAAAKNALEAKG